MKWLPSTRRISALLVVAGCSATSACSDSPPDPGADAAPDVELIDSALPPNDKSPDAMLDRVSPDVAPDVTSSDVKPDGDGGSLTDKVVSDSDVACVEEPPVLVPTRFAFTRYFPTNGIKDAGCDGKLRLYQYSPDDQTVVEQSCTNAMFVRRTVALTTEGTNRINAVLLALRATCSIVRVPDYFPDMIQIFDDRGCAVREYHDNHEGSPQAPPPYLDYPMLASLGTLLEDSVRAACAPHDASTFEAGAGPGTCVLGLDDTDAGPWGVCGDAAAPEADSGPFDAPDVDGSIADAIPSSG